MKYREYVTYIEDNAKSHACLEVPNVKVSAEKNVLA
jgi:hypothetical protein